MGYSRSASWPKASTGCWKSSAAIVAFLVFLGYQLYRYTHTHSPELLVLSVFDVFIIALTWLEYRRLRAAHAFS